MGEVVSGGGGEEPLCPTMITEYMTVPEVPWFGPKLIVPGEKVCSYNSSSSSELVVIVCPVFEKACNHVGR